MKTDRNHREYGSFLHWFSFDPPAVPVSHPWGDDRVLFASGVDALRGLMEHGRSTRSWRRLWAPSYFCQDVMRSLLTAGLQVVLYDYGPEDTCSLGSRIRAEPGDVVLRVNFFGLRGRLSIDGIDRSCVEILDDHTHDPWSDWAYTSDADWCVVSPRKTLPLPGGGVLWSPRRHPLPAPSPVTDARRIATFEKFTAMVLKGLYLQGHPLDREVSWRLSDAAEDHLSSDEVSGLPEWIPDLLNCFPVEDWRERRRDNCRGVSSVLKGLPWLKVLEADSGSGTCQFSGVVLFDSEERRDFVRHELSARRIFPTVLWELDDAAIPGIPEEHRRFSKTLLCIPCDARYDRATVEKVSGLIRDIGNVAMAPSNHAFTAPTRHGETDDDEADSGVLSFLSRRFTRDLAGVDVVISGIAYDLSTSNRPGSRFGPRSLRQASCHISWGPQWPFDFDPTHRLAIVDWGDHRFQRQTTDSMVEAVEANTAGFLKAGCFPITMGGDHLVTLPLLRAMAKHHGAGLSLVHFDAHHDTDRSERLNHGSVFWHATQEGLIDPAHSIHIGVRMHNGWDDGFHVIDARQVQKMAPEATAERILEVTGGNRTYLSFDIDFLDPSCAPGTGTPVVGGPNTTTALEILGLLGRLKLVGMDLVEVAPDYDVSEITALAGASIMYQVLHLLALDKPVAPATRKA